ncbi:MAG: NADPH-dependent FMN reductase [Parcubacteria bacterium C7867-001]|nr:MAG: NADPH-dependent FMN reductase [Parcubacteria bacterium C7867-001]
MKKIFILLGNPDADTLSGQFASVYESAATAAGHEVKRLNIGDLAFDPILHKGYKVIQELEPDLKTAQEYMKWCDTFVLVYPLWWSSMPALLKGFFDRMWLPAFAFRFHKNPKTGKAGMFWDRLMRGKRARVIMLSKANPFLIWFMFGDFTNEITRAILAFAGFVPRVTEIGNAEILSDAQKRTWEKRLSALAKKGV